MKFPPIAIIGGMGVGKSTILGVLVRRFNYQRMSWADPVKQLAALAYGEVGKNTVYEVHDSEGRRVEKLGRTILQQIGTDALRNIVDDDFWVRIGTRMMDAEAKGTTGSNIRWVNDDTRFMNEAMALRERGFAFVRLLVPDAVRASRLGVNEDQLRVMSTHPSETSLARFEADFDILNDGTRSPDDVTQDIIDYLTDLMK